MAQSILGVVGECSLAAGICAAKNDHPAHDHEAHMHGHHEATSWGWLG
jgi:hypothetical protein